MHDAFLYATGERLAACWSHDTYGHTATASYAVMLRPCMLDPVVRGLIGVQGSPLGYLLMLTSSICRTSYGC